MRPPLPWPVKPPVASAKAVAPGPMYTAWALRRLASRPWAPPPMRRSPPLAPEASTTDPSSKATCRPCSVMLPPAPAAPRALVRLPAPACTVSDPVSHTWPAGPVPRPSARTSPCWLTSAACKSMRPPAAITWPRFSASPAGAVSRTARCGKPESTRSTLRPAASSTWPSGASIRPSLRTPAVPISSTRPPLSVRNSPWFSTPASAWPAAAGPAARLKRPACQSALPMFNVDATRPATSTRAVAPNNTPLGLSNHTWPLLLRLPKMADGSLPTTRLSTLLAAPGCSNRTLLPAPMENCCQFSSALAELVTVMRLPWVSTDAWPCTTCQPVGKAPAPAAPAGPAPSKQATASASGANTNRGRRAVRPRWRDVKPAAKRGRVRYRTVIANSPDRVGPAA